MQTHCNSILKQAISVIVIHAVCLVVTVAYGVQTNIWQDIDDDWFNAANWSLGHYPADGEAVKIEAATVDIRLTNATAVLDSFELAAGITLIVEGWESALTATNITVAGRITHADHWHVTTTNAIGEWPLEHRVYLRGSNITIAAGATLDADELGYPSGSGPGGAGGTRDGGGHAGLGGVGYVGGHVGGGPEYGDPEEPFQPGSGGASATLGGYGGGVIRIAAEGHLQIAGTLSVNGRNALGTHGAGGSGGSIWLSCRTFGGTATGLVRANGGNGSSQGGGGAAGRMALHYTSQSQAPLAEPIPPVRFDGQPGNAGGNVNTVFPAAMGTLFLPDTLFITESMTAQRLWYIRPVIPGFTEWEPDALTLDNCVIGLPEGFRLVVTNDLILQNNAGFHVFAASVADPMTEDGAVVEVGGDLTLAGDSWIYPYAADTNGASVGFYLAGDLTIAEGCGFNADDRGFRWQHGPGQEYQRYAELGVSLALGNGSGSGHGGAGGPGYNCNGGGRYGEASAPRLPGSGSKRVYSGRGGGAIRIVSEGHAQIDGLLSARAGTGNGHSQYGSGSGGSIWMTCRTLGGSAAGMFRADGGNGRHNAGAGGGGRISVIYDSTAQQARTVPAIRYSAAAGATWDNTPFYHAEMGTLYFPDLQLLQTLIEAGSILQASLEIPGFTSWALSSLTVEGGEFAFPAGIELEIAGDLTLLDGARMHLHAAPTNGVSGRYGSRLTVGGDLKINNNAWLLPHAAWTNGAVVGVRVGGDVWIDEGSGIDAQGKGFAPVPDNGNGTGAGQNSSSGGGYGGKGGGTGGGITYGNEKLPLEPGSPAGWYTGGSQLRAASGGGAIHLLAGGAIHIDGLLNANAGPGALNYSGTGGSGGSILLSAGRQLTGSGGLEASGSLNRGRTDADGGGGRIAVWTWMPLSEIEPIVAVGEVRSGVILEPYPHFEGDIDALAASESADDGTAFVYAMQGTLIQLR